MTVWLAAWCVHARVGEEVGGVLGTRAGTTGCSCDPLRVTSQREWEREKRRGGHIWTHSWLMQLRVRPRARTLSWNKRREYQSSHLSGPNCDAWWDCVSHAGPIWCESYIRGLKPFERGILTLTGFRLDDSKDGLTFRGEDLQRLMRGHGVLFNSHTLLQRRTHTYAYASTLTHPGGGLVLARLSVSS